MEHAKLKSAITCSLKGPKLRKLRGPYYDLNHRDPSYSHVRAIPMWLNSLSISARVEGLDDAAELGAIKDHVNCRTKTSSTKGVLSQSKFGFCGFSGPCVPC